MHGLMNVKLRFVYVSYKVKYQNIITEALWESFFISGLMAIIQEAMELRHVTPGQPRS